MADKWQNFSDDMLIPKVMIDRVQSLMVEFESASSHKSENMVEVEKELRMEAAILFGNSVYPEVRAVCDPFDDPVSSLQPFLLRNYTES